MSSPSKPSPTWDAAKQARWQATKPPGQPLVVHILLDASGSMVPYAGRLRGGYNLYLRFLQRAAPPLSMLDTRCFGTVLQGRPDQPPHRNWSDEVLPPCEALALGRAADLTADTYQANYGATALYDAIGTVCTTATAPGQHLLIVFTDGNDNMSGTWTADTLREVLATKEVYEAPHG